MTVNDRLKILAKKIVPAKERKKKVEKVEEPKEIDITPNTLYGIPPLTMKELVMTQKEAAEKYQQYIILEQKHAEEWMKKFEEALKKDLKDGKFKI